MKKLDIIGITICMWKHLIPEFSSGSAVFEGFWIPVTNKSAELWETEKWRESFERLEKKCMHHESWLGEKPRLRLEIFDSLSQHDLARKKNKQTTDYKYAQKRIRIGKKELYGIV